MTRKHFQEYELRIADMDIKLGIPEERDYTREFVMTVLGIAVVLAFGYFLNSFTNAVLALH